MGAVGRVRTSRMASRVDVRSVWDVCMRVRAAARRPERARAAVVSRRGVVGREVVVVTEVGSSGTVLVGVGGREKRRSGWRGGAPRRGRCETSAPASELVVGEERSSGRTSRGGGKGWLLR